ncbi:MAG: HNH endonuclease signature motif containing protein [bacterium]
MAEQYIRNPNTVCTVCKKPIYRRPVQLKTSNGNAFCTMSCYGLFCRKEVPCTICEKLILSGLHKKTCSRACSNRSRAGMSYNHNQPHDKVKNYKALKIRLLNKDGKSCKKCGYNKQEILQVHHKDKNRLNNDLGNLELICPNCHFEEHYLEKSWLKATSD